MPISKINTTSITDNSVTAGKIVAGAVDADIAAGSIDTAQIADDAVTADKLANAINTSIAAKLPLAGGSLTGNLGIGASSLSNGRLTLEGVDGGNSAGIYFNNTTATNGKSYSLSSGNAGEFMLYDRTSSNYRLFVNTSGNVGVGTSSPSEKIHIGASGNDDKNSIKIDGSNGSGQTFATIIESDGENSRVSIKTGGSNSTPTQKLMIQPDGGICFGTDTAAANALDDYEEGNWTPTDENGVAFTKNVNALSCMYTKIGRQVTLHMDITGVASSSGNQIKGLPYNGMANVGQSGNLFNGFATGIDANVGGHVYGDAIYLYAGQTAQNLTNGRRIIANAIYFTDA